MARLSASAIHSELKQGRVLALARPKNPSRKMLEYEIPESRRRIYFRQPTDEPDIIDKALRADIIGGVNLDIQTSAVYFLRQQPRIIIPYEAAWDAMISPYQKGEIVGRRTLLREGAEQLQQSAILPKNTRKALENMGKELFSGNEKDAILGYIGLAATLRHFAFAEGRLIRKNKPKIDPDNIAYTFQEPQTKFPEKEIQPGNKYDWFQRQQ